MSIIPIAAPDIPVLWHNAVVDIEPTSQYGLDRDLASVNSTLCYSNPFTEPVTLTLLAPSQTETECNLRWQSGGKAAQQEAQPLDAAPYRPALEALAASRWGTAALERILERSGKHFVGSAPLQTGPQVVRFHTRIPIAEGEERTYELALSVPMGAGPLGQGARLNVVALLPSQSPHYQLEVVDWSAEDEPGAEVAVYGGDGAALSGRAAVAWSWVRAPFLWVKYRYRR